MVKSGAIDRQRKTVQISRKVEEKFTQNVPNYTSKIVLNLEYFNLLKITLEILKISTNHKYCNLLKQAKYNKKQKCILCIYIFK